MQDQAQVVIIGGGIVGSSVAYHLTKIGWTDVLLLERKELACGTTWAAAGLLTQLRQNQEMTNLAKYTVDLYEGLEAETEVSTGFRRNGAVAVCQTEDRRKELLRAAAMARAFGIEMSEISPKEAGELVPGMTTKDLVAAFYLPGDGVTNPIETTRALAKGAKMRGAKIIENIMVTDIKVENGAVCGVTTDRGEVTCEYVVNCAGMWGRQVGQLVNVSVPLHAAEHMHAVTLPIEGLKKHFPTVRDFDGVTYFKSESDGILFGGFEVESKPWGMKGIPKNIMYHELQEDWDQFQAFMDCALKRFPAMESTQIRHLSVVPESFTPDTAFMTGEAPGVKNFFIGCGMNSVGIQSAGGVGRALAHWIDKGHPEEQLWPVDIRRFFPWQQNARYLYDRTKESVGVLYHHHYPNRQRTTGRPVICSPIHDRLVAHGAAFSQNAGWERADWFAPEGVEPVYKYSWGKPNWFQYQSEEHMAVRDGVGLYDLSSMGKFLVQGRDSEAVLQYLCSNDIRVPIGQVVYTPILNERGGFEADVTVTRFSEDTFFIVTGAATVVRDLDYIKRRIPADTNAVITNVTQAYTMLAVMGPRSRDLLRPLTDADLSNANFPYSTAQQVDIAYARPWAVRMSYVGELGWELYIPTMFTVPVFDAIMDEGNKVGLHLIGMQAVNSLRLETGYRHWESDITPDDTPYEAGLGFGVKLDKGDFIGRAALLKQKEAGIKRKIVMFTLDDPDIMLYGSEPIYRDSIWMENLTSGAYGFKLGSAVGMGYVKDENGITDDWILAGKYEVEVEGRMIPAKIHLRSPYDPKNQRPKM
ncbi:MAG: FAD-dependent oxidoreductase [Desulfobacterales bacterium]|jgi:4-methylaminobutanoate oxidase (formaldehyde-forming)